MRRSTSLAAANVSSHSSRWRSVGSLICIAFVAAATQGCTHTPPPTPAEAAQSEKTVAAQMIKLGTEHTDGFLTHSQTLAIRNMLGGVRGIFVAPDISGGAAFVGVESGTGFVMRRHGATWSDPVFYKLSITSAGWEAGAKSSRMLILMMTDAAVDNFIKGNMEIGGTGGFALGNYGAGASGAGEMKGGLELLILTTNKGAFLGGGWADTKPTPATKLNDDIYGPNANVNAILAAPGGKYAPATELRTRLAKMVAEAWDVSGK